ncbi:MAG TPA: enoyl-CoA hydratase-related protein [Magnetospirillum sp.]|nr:enoyl-CoA hydratase-related protein [Magnetospirillum sp.]
MSQNIVVTTENGIRTIRISRPEKKNAISHGMYADLTNALEEGEADEAVRVFVVAGDVMHSAPETISTISSR